MSDTGGIIATVTVWILPIILAVTMHEAAHGYVARLFGDMTASRLGRVTLNPFKHIDVFGTLVLPAVFLMGSGGSAMFGYAKPVLVDFRALKPLRPGMVAVAIAGPGINVVLAFLSLLALRYLLEMSPTSASWLAQNLTNSVRINISLAILNMLPIPPLDGGRILVAILPRRLAVRVAALEGAGILILLALIFVPRMLGEQFGRNWDLFSVIVGVPAAWLLRALMTLVGVA